MRQGQFMKGAGTASSPLLVGPQEDEPGTKPSPPLTLRLHGSVHARRP